MRRCQCPTGTATPPLKSATTRSSLPSPFTSAVVTNSGLGPAKKGAAGLNAPVPVPSSTETPPLPATTRSSLPSPFTSAVVADCWVGVHEGGGRAQCAGAGAEQHSSVAAAAAVENIRDDKVELAVPVYIRCSTDPRVRRSGIDGGRAKCAGACAQQHRNPTFNHNGDVELASPVHIQPSVTEKGLP